MYQRPSAQVLAIYHDEYKKSGSYFLLHTCSVMTNECITALLAPYCLLFETNAYSRRRCAFGDDCWPDDSTWQAFNNSVSGRLTRSVLSPVVCHEERYNADLCATAQKEWKEIFWRTNQTGAYSASLWELGNDDQCFINSSTDTPCDPGIGKLSISWLVSSRSSSC